LPSRHLRKALSADRATHRRDIAGQECAKAVSLLKNLRQEESASAHRMPSIDALGESVGDGREQFVARSSLEPADEGRCWSKISKAQVLRC
jgi:hypothetical protein